MSNITIKELEKSVKFECEISKPDLKIDWSYNSKIIRKDEKYEIQSSGCTHTLTVTDLSVTDVGQYKASYGNLITDCEFSIESK